MYVQNSPTKGLAMARFPSDGKQERSPKAISAPLFVIGILCLFFLTVYVVAFPIGAADLLFDNSILHRDEAAAFKSTIPEKQLGREVLYSPWSTNESHRETARDCVLELPLHVLYYRERFTVVSDKQVDFDRYHFRTRVKVISVVSVYLLYILLWIVGWHVWQMIVPRWYRFVNLRNKTRVRGRVRGTQYRIIGGIPDTRPDSDSQETPSASRHGRIWQEWSF